MRIYLIGMFFMFINFANSQITDTIDVSYYKAVILHFDCDTVGYEVGSEKVSVRWPKEKLIIQAIKRDFEETNLYAQCNGKEYLFIVRYRENVKRFTYDYRMKEKSSAKSISKKELALEKKDSLDVLYTKVANHLMTSKDRFHNKGVIKYRLGVYLRDIVIAHDKLFMEFEAENKSFIPYYLDFKKFNVSPVKRRIKGASTQIVELTPVFEHDTPPVIRGKETKKYVVALDKFVLTKNKKLIVELWEDNGRDLNIEGGRKVSFNINYKDILDAINVE